MLTSHNSARGTACKQQCRYKHIQGSRRPVICAAAGSSRQQQGWHWPFSRNTADEEETEIVYVTDTAEADEIIEEDDYVQDDHYGQPEQQLAAGGAHDSTTAAQQATAEMEDAAAFSSSNQQVEVEHWQEAPEATTTVSASVYPHQQQQHLQDTLTSPSTSQTVSQQSQQPAFASTSLASPASSSYWATSAGGWVVALSLLFAVRQGRQHADAARLDVRALQSRQHESRVQSRELKEKRALYLQQQTLLKEEAAAKRLAEQARVAEQARRQAAAKAKEYEMTAKEELDKLRADRAAARKAFEKSQGKLEEELATRTAREIAIREEAEAKKAAEAAQKRAKAAAEAARAAAEATAAAEAAEEAARQAAAARAALKQQLRDSSTRYQLHLQGTALAAPVSTGGGKPQLSVTLTLLPDTSAASSSSSSSSSSESGGTAQPSPVAKVQRVYDSSDAATDGAAELAVQTAQQVYTHYVPAAAEGTVDLQGLSVTQQQQDRQQQQQQQNQQQQQQQQQQQDLQAQGLPSSSSSASISSAGVQLSEADSMLWRLLLLSRLEAAGRQAIGQVAPLAASGQLQQDLMAHVSYSTLPQSDPNSLQQRLQQCADLVSQQQLPVAIQLLDDVIEWQLEDFLNTDLSSYSSSSSTVAQLLQQVVSSGVAAGCPASPYLVPAYVYAVLLDLFDPATQAINKRRKDTISISGAGGEASTASSTEASRANSVTSTAADEDDDNMFDAVGPTSTPSSSRSLPPALARRSIVTDQDSNLQRLAKFQLEQLEKAAPADSLAPAAVCLRLLLGRKHPVAAAMQLLAERNMSPGARQARALRAQQKQLAMATELLQGSGVMGPGGLDPQGAGTRQQLVPAPERIWALRNVANSMLRSTASSGGGGSSSSSTPSAEEAVSMLKTASDLAAEHYGMSHPGRLSVLLDYISALLVVPGHQSEAKAAIEAVCGIVAAAAERYRQQKDLLSLVLLYESTQAELDVPEVVGRECVAMTRLQRQAADAFGVLETAQANVVMTRRKLAPGSSGTALRQLAKDCTEQLGVYAAVKKRDTRLDQWNKGLPLAPLR